MRTSNLIENFQQQRRWIASISAMALFATAAPALAQDAAEPASDFTLSGNSALTTDYRFRGVSLSDGDIAIQGGFDVNHKSGFYVGTWASSIEDSPRFGHTELDLYGGWTGEVISGLTVDAGLLYYVYPNGDGGAAGPSDYFEPYASVAGTLGPVQATVGVAYAPSQAAIGHDDSVFIYSDLSAGIPQTPITVKGHLGYTDGSLSVGDDGDNLDWSVGADWAVTSKLTASVAYVGVGGPKINNFTDETVVFTLGVAF